MSGHHSTKLVIAGVFAVITFLVLFRGEHPSKLATAITQSTAHSADHVTHAADHTTQPIHNPPPAQALKTFYEMALEIGTDKGMISIPLTDSSY